MASGMVAPTGCFALCPRVGGRVRNILFESRTLRKKSLSEVLCCSPVQELATLISFYTTSRWRVRQPFLAMHCRLHPADPDLSPNPFVFGSFPPRRWPNKSPAKKSNIYRFSPARLGSRCVHRTCPAAVRTAISSLPQRSPACRPAGSRRGVLRTAPGTRRGFIQGSCSSRLWPSIWFSKGRLRLGGSFLVILLGFGLTGVIVANSAAIVVTPFCNSETSRRGPFQAFSTGGLSRRAAGYRLLCEPGVAINNCDIGRKAFLLLWRAVRGVALVSRVVYALSWSVISTMFPIVAGTRKSERKGYGVLGTSLLLVGIGSILMGSGWHDANPGPRCLAPSSGYPAQPAFPAGAVCRHNYDTPSAW